MATSFSKLNVQALFSAPLLPLPRDGLAAARSRGRTGGQRPKMTKRQAKIARDMYEEQKPDGSRAHTVQQIAEEFGVSRPTIYRHLRALDNEPVT